MNDIRKPSDQASPPTDLHAPLRRGIIGLVVVLGGFIAWASLAPLDEGVALNGIVAVEGKRKAVQHLTGGMVASLEVQEGDHVKAGQVLLTLDTNNLNGQVEMARSQIAGLASQQASLRQQIPLRKQQVVSLGEDINRLAPLAREQLYPRNRIEEMRRQQNQLRAQLDSDTANLAQATSQEMEQRERLAVLQTELSRSVVRAPIDGTVLGLTVHTLGAIIQPGAQIMEIVPANDVLVIEAQIPPHQIRSVRAGLKTQLRFLALDQRKTPVIDGLVDRVSADLVTDREGHSYYTTRVLVPADQLKRLGKAKLQPGMPVETIVITGERTFLNYLLKPISDSFARGLKEH